MRVGRWSTALDVRSRSSTLVRIVQYNEIIHFLILSQPRYNVVPCGLFAWVSRRLEQEHHLFCITGTSGTHSFAVIAQPVPSGWHRKSRLLSCLHLFLVVCIMRRNPAWWDGVDLRRH